MKGLEKEGWTLGTDERKEVESQDTVYKTLSVNTGVSNLWPVYQVWSLGGLRPAPQPDPGVKKNGHRNGFTINPTKPLENLPVVGRKLGEEP